MNSRISIYAVLALAVLNTVFAGIPFKDCGSDGIKITNFDVSGCTALPCIFKKGNDVTVTIEATASKDFTSIKNVVYGKIAGVNVPFSFPQADACSNGLTCPVKSGDTMKQTITLPVLTAYPSLSLYVQYQMNDQDNKQQACALFPVKLE